MLPRPLRASWTDGFYVGTRWYHPRGREKPRESLLFDGTNYGFLHGGWLRTKQVIILTNDDDDSYTDDYNDKYTYAYFIDQ